MHKIDGDGHNNYTFQSEDAANNIPATEVTPAWLNAVQAELAALATATGAELDKGNNEQALAAVQHLIANVTTTMPDGAIWQAIIRMTNVRLWPVNYSSQDDAIANGWLLLDGTLVPFGDLWTEEMRASLNSLVNPSVGGIWSEIATAYVPNQSITVVERDDVYAAVSRARRLGEWQEDAIRNITANVGMRYNTLQSPTGAFGGTTNSHSGWSTGGSTQTLANLDFNASRVVPTADRNRPQSHVQATHWGFYFMDV